MTLNLYKFQCNTENTIYYSWFKMYEDFGILASSLNNGTKNHVDMKLIQLFINVFQIAYALDINLDHAWKSWKKKAYSKNYCTNSIPRSQSLGELQKPSKLYSFKSYSPNMHRF